MQGFGAIKAALQACGKLPRHVYISHNHSDHSAELPVMLAVQQAAGQRMVVHAEAGVMQRLLEHRLHELRSTRTPQAHPNASMKLLAVHSDTAGHALIAQLA